jgi:transcription antitermination protein NusB
MGFRRQARELTLKMLFQIDLGKLKSEEVLTYFLGEVKASAEVSDYAEFLTRGIVRELSYLDELISSQAKHWKLTRIAGVDRNVLRIAVFELLRCPAVPVNVVLNEAIEIAKKYSTQESGSFVNGILDKLQSKRAPAE